MLKRTILRKDPTFNEADYGFRGFGELMRHLADRGVVELGESSARGDPEVTIAEQGDDETAAFSLLRTTVERLASGKSGPPHLSGLKTQMRKSDPDFTEKRFGFGGFLQFAKAARARGFVDMEFDAKRGRTRRTADADAQGDPYFTDMRSASTPSCSSRGGAGARLRRHGLRREHRGLRAAPRRRRPTHPTEPRRPGAESLDARHRTPVGSRRHGRSTSPQTARAGTGARRCTSASRFYDVDGWLRDAPGPRERETEVLGDVDGHTLVHLQCHFGLDTLQFARAGARVVGLDFSPAAIDAARDLARADRARRSCRVRVRRRARRGRRARRSHLRHRLREPRRAVLAPERRPLGGAGRGARRARRSCSTCTTATRWRGPSTTTSRGSHTRTSRSPSPTSTTPGLTYTDGVTELDPGAATSGTTASARPSPR